MREGTLSTSASKGDKKIGRQGMPPNRGMNASNREVHTQHHRCKGSVESTFYKLPKKWGCSLSTPAFDASPPFHRKGSNQRMTRGMATQRRHNDRTTTWVTGHTKKEGSQVPPAFAHSPFRRRLSGCSPRHGPGAIRRRAHLKGGWGTRLKVVETWFVVLIGL